MLKTNFSIKLISLLTYILNLAQFTLEIFGHLILHILETLFRYIISFKVAVLKPKIPSLPSNIRLNYSPLYFVGGVVFTVIFVFIPVQIYFWYVELPTPELLALKAKNSNTVILDKYGRLLFKLNEDYDYENVNITQIPDVVVKSTLAIEDHEFYSHYGFRPLSIIRAARANIIYDDPQGGSTITQQLVKMVLLSPEKTFTRKIKELVLAILVEKKYTKNQILEMYLNNVSYGGSSVGIQSAAKKYYGKNVWDLSLAEATMLAGLPSAPSVYSPVTGDFEKAKLRQLYVLDRMKSLGYINPEQAESALKEDLIFVKDSGYIRAPHFVNYIIDLLSDEYGYNYVRTGGLTVRTSLDLDVQEKVQKIVSEGVAKSKGLNITNGAALILDKNSNNIVAYVGSIDFSVTGWGRYDVIRAKRQPGSSIKPVTYALAFINGQKPDSKISDEELVIKNDWETYRPVNYDGKFHGEVTLQSALANSYNIPAVKLAQKYGPANVVDLASKMGIKSWSASDADYGVSVTLGGKEVTMLELANVYATIARNGVYHEIDPVLSVKDPNGYEIYANTQDLIFEPEQVLPVKVASELTTILASNQLRSSAFGPNSALVIPNKNVSVKTGTTDKKRDNWTLGYDSNYVVAVWVGNNNNAPMNPNLASGLSGAAPIWHQIFVEAVK